MPEFATVKMSSIMALEGKPLNARHLIRLKRRLDARDADETLRNIKEETASMCFEALDRLQKASSLRQRVALMTKVARFEEEEAEDLTNTAKQTIVLRSGLSFKR
jgi:hypothetical protein